MKIIVMMVIAVFVTSCAMAQGYQTYYSATELAGLDADTTALNINNRGMISGSVNDANWNSFACIWNEESLTLMNSGIARSVNSSGVACGESHLDIQTSMMYIDPGPMACVWEEGEKPVFLSGSPYSTANAINGSGLIAGQDMVYVGYGMTMAMPCAWIDQEESILSLSEGYATDINKKGQIVGTTYQDQVVATLWSPDKTERILGPGYAASINDWGQVVGYSMYQGKARACSWTTGSVPTKFEWLGSLGRESWANDVNLLGQAVGMAVRPDGQYRAVIYLRGGKIFDLNDRVLLPDWRLYCADSINDSGQIVARGTNRSGETRGFLLKPVKVWR